ncbi:isochorismatase family cysteine hydrolase [Clostridium oryzae]|uniref:Isochorismatase family protein n=1 Tax=Clostridium oryzae TaxID=1450648 RepID=A0A1V4IUU0_9CLOT|nr:isochorismatase family cysteine hydrolase [Clostridium oryzae]OPJ63555.1 isochorismatase family protein [Clostridium oryzae]
MDKFEQLKKEVIGSELNFNELDMNMTVLVVVDMVRGFMYEGALASPRVISIIPKIMELVNKCDKADKIFFADCHKENSVEFKSYPKHCIENTSEVELAEELKQAAADNKNIHIIYKNSTNGFHAPDFQKWLSQNKEKIDNYIVVGCVTDICCLQFTLTLNSYFNEYNLKKRIIVPENGVETYDFGVHNGELMNMFALYNMKINGIEIVK